MSPLKFSKLFRGCYRFSKLQNSLYLREIKFEKELSEAIEVSVEAFSTVISIIGIRVVILKRLQTCYSKPEEYYAEGKSNEAKL